MDCERIKDNSGSTLSCFLQWCKQVGLELSTKVCVSVDGTVARYGMLATQQIQEGELLFSIPRSILLSPHTSAIRDLLKKEEAALHSQSGWVPLLIALLYEVTSSSSHWQPYLSLWPGFSSLDHPMFWEEGERARLLQGTEVLEAVRKDLRNIEDEHQRTVLPFLRQHPHTFPPGTHCLQLYKRLAAFVMAYSFQEPLHSDEEDDEDEELNPPMMVPMADILNHVSNHNTNLEFTHDCLRMVSLRAIPAGEEIFNTYGQLANWQLLHMYGFVELPARNSQDTVEIPMETMRQAALHGLGSDQDQEQILERWEFLKRLEIVGDGGAFVIGQTGVLTEEELYTVLKVLTMSLQEFQEFREQEGWEEVEEKPTVTHVELAGLAPGWKRLLREAVRLRLGAYSSSLRHDQELLDGKVPSQRHQFALHLRLGQKHILNNLLHLLADNP